jgi:hypothetical protein
MWIREGFPLCIKKAKEYSYLRNYYVLLYYRTKRKEN